MSNNETSSILPTTDNNRQTGNDAGADSSFPSTSQLSCPIDLSCMWTGPKWALTAWVSSAAGFLGMNPTNEPDIIHNGTAMVDDETSNNRGRHHPPLGNARGRGNRNPRYVPLTTSTKSITSQDPHALENVNDEDAESDDNSDRKQMIISEQNRRRQQQHENNNNNNIALINTEFFSSNRPIGSPLVPIRLSAEFEVWQKYIRDLSNFSAIDVDVQIVASSSDPLAPAPFLHLTIRGPIIPSIGRCRRTLDDSAFIAPQSVDEWHAANPIAVMEVVEAFLLSVVAPESVEDDDAIETIIDAGTSILAHPARELQDFLKMVAEFVEQTCVGIKLVIRDIDFTAEFESSRQAHAERFLVLDTTSNPNGTAIAREPRGMSSISGLFSSLVGNFSSSNNNTNNVSTNNHNTTASNNHSSGLDFGSCPVAAINAFESDYSMLDIVKSVRNLIRRLIQNIPILKSIEVRGCLIRDSDLDVNGIFCGRNSIFAVKEEGDRRNSNQDDDQSNGSSSSSTNSKAQSEVEGSENRCFPYRSGIIVKSELKRLTGPSRLVIEHCGLTDSHLNALIRLLRVETEKSRRSIMAPSSEAENEVSRKLKLLSVHFLSSLSSIRLSGQFYPMALVGLISAMQDTFDDGKLHWAKKLNRIEMAKRNATAEKSEDEKSGGKFAEAEDRARRIQFTLDEVEVPANAVHTIREACSSRGLGSELTVRSTD